MNRLSKILFVIAIVLLAFPILMNSIFNLGFESNVILYYYSFVALIGFGWLLSSLRGDFFEVRLLASTVPIFFGFSFVMLLLKEADGAKKMALLASVFLVLTVAAYLGKELISRDNRVDETATERFKAERLARFRASIVALAYVSLILFFVGIILYDNSLIREGVLQIIGGITAIFYIAVHGFQLEKYEVVVSILNYRLERPRTILSQLLKFFIILNLYLFPFVVMVVLGIVFTAELDVVSLIQMKGILILYLISLSLLIINTYTFREKRGFVKWSGETGALFKTIFYVFVPAYIIGLLLVGQFSILANEIVIGFLLAVGSLWIIHRDTFYHCFRLRYSGETFFCSYIESLLRYGFFFFIIFGAYFVAGYSRDHDLRDLIKTESVSVFSDMPADHLAYAAMFHLYENHLITPDANNFIHPSLELNNSSTLDMIFDYFDIQEADFAEHQDVSFKRISQSDEHYPLFKAAYHLGLVRKDIDPEIAATRKFALTVLGNLEGWPADQASDGYIAYAYKIGIIDSMDTRLMNDSITRVILAQILFDCFVGLYC